MRNFFKFVVASKRHILERRNQAVGTSVTLHSCLVHFCVTAIASLFAVQFKTDLTLQGPTYSELRHSFYVFSFVYKDEVVMYLVWIGRLVWSAIQILLPFKFSFTIYWM